LRWNPPSTSPEYAIREIWIERHVASRFCGLNILYVLVDDTAINVEPEAQPIHVTPAESQALTDSEAQKQAQQSNLIERPAENCSTIFVLVRKHVSQAGMNPFCVLAINENICGHPGTPDEKLLHNVANRPARRTMLPFSWSKRKFPLETIGSRRNRRPMYESLSTGLALGATVNFFR